MISANLWKAAVRRRPVRQTSANIGMARVSTRSDDFPPAMKRGNRCGLAFAWSTQRSLEKKIERPLIVQTLTSEDESGNGGGEEDDDDDGVDRGGSAETFAAPDGATLRSDIHPSFREKVKWWEAYAHQKKEPDGTAPRVPEGGQEAAARRKNTELVLVSREGTSVDFLGAYERRVTKCVPHRARHFWKLASWSSERPGLSPPAAPARLCCSSM